MKQSEQEKTPQESSELDTVLAKMAEEVPPMPADFHDRWMNAIRKEAEKAVPATESHPQKSRISPVRWTRILSAAAAFIFLIGGTVLYRNSKKTLNAAFPAKEKAEVMMSAEAPAAKEEAEAADMEGDAAPEAVRAEEAMTAGVLTEEAATAEADYDALPALFANAAKGSEDAGIREAPKAALGGMMEAASEEACEMEEEEPEEACEEAGDFAAMEEPETAPLLTAMPTKPAAESEESREQSTDEPEAGFFQNAGAFLTDMGDFLLAALPYLAVLAVPAAVALVIRRKKGQSAG